MEAFAEPESASKKELKRCRVKASEFGMSMSRTMLLTSAKDTRTYFCCVLYVLEGSERAGSIDTMNRVKIS